MQKIYILLCILSLLMTQIVFAAGTEGKSDWPQWRGKNHDSKALDTGVIKAGYGLKINWKRPLGSGYSSVSVSGGHAVTMFSDSTFDYVVSLDAESGAEQWRSKLDSTYAGHDGSHNGPISTPMIESGKVFALGPKGHLVALDLATGKKVWEANLPQNYKSIAPFYGFTTSPVVDDNVFIVETGGVNSTISGFDKNSGKLLWSAGSDTVHHQSPLIFSLDGIKHLVGVGDKYLYGLNPQTGEVYWEYHHNGGRQAINPVVTGSNRLFFDASNREAVMIEINREGDKYVAKELWKTRELTRTLNIPVFFENNIYGYTGTFICSVDAETGKLNWKSRPPGDGFLILVDGHLVVITRQGAMHIIKATPESYQEVASLDVFDKLTWTPPSFANGRIYARNLYEIAAVDIVPTDQPLPIAVKQMSAPNSKFGKWVTQVEQSADKQKMVDEYMAKQKSFPIIEDKKYAHIVYQGDVSDIALAGDMIETNIELPLNRIEGTNFYYASFELKPDARLNYRFNINFEQRNPDPRNKIQAPSTFGPMSELAMPDWKRPIHFDEPAHKMRGQIDSLNFESKILNNQRTIKVYLPAGYENGSQRYPALYVNNGNQAIQLGNVPNTLDNLIGKTIEPVIAVFIDAPNSFQEYARQQRDQFAEMVAKEIVPMIDQKYRTIARAEARAFMGGDEGGHAAINTAFKYPGTFAMVAGQSTHMLNTSGINEGDLLRKTVRDTEKQPIRFYLDWGTYDYRNARGGYDWVEYNRTFAKILAEKGYDWSGGEVSEGWDFSSWRNRTDKILEAFFPLKKTQK